MFKFLDPAGCTYYNGEPFAYNLPGRDEKWATTEHPDPSPPDGKACGPGRLHVMKDLDMRYAPPHWWPWWAEGKGLIGEDDEKAAYWVVRLRRIPKKLFWRCLRPPFNWGRDANLRGADLCAANLRGADLWDADLCAANLWNAILRGANLVDANLWNAILRGADLRGANLCAANLRDANLRGADLRDAILWNANLRGADLRDANLWNAILRGADLRGANLCAANLRDANLRGADLRDANLWNAILRGANLVATIHNQHTHWPAGYSPEWRS